MKLYFVLRCENIFHFYFSNISRLSNIIHHWYIFSYCDDADHVLGFHTVVYLQVFNLVFSCVPPNQDNLCVLYICVHMCVMWGPEVERCCVLLLSTLFFELRSLTETTTPWWGKKKYLIRPRNLPAFPALVPQTWVLKLRLSCVFRT